MGRPSKSIEEDIVRINDKVNAALWIAIPASALIIIHVVFRLVEIWR